MSEQRTELQLPAGLRERVMAAAAASTPKGGSSAPEPSFARRVALSSVFGLAWLSGMFAVYQARKNLSDLPLSATWLPFVAALAIGVGLTVLASARGRAMLGAPSPVLTWLSFVAPLTLGVAAIGGARAAVAEPAAPLEAVLHGAMRCDSVAFLVAIPLVLALVWLRKPLTFAAPWFAGGAAGVAAYAWAHAVLAWHCGSVETWHLVVGHVLPVVPLAVLGAWVTGRVQAR